jgi:hypothetical protein
MDNQAPSMLKPTLIGGLIFGVVGGLPVISALNCACCSLVVAGGFLASYLYSKECRREGAEFRAGGGALIGLVAGLFYALASTVIGALVKLVMPPPDPQEIAGMMEQFGAPPESIDMMMRFMEGGESFVGVIITFFIMLLIAAIFSTIGGLIGGAVFKVEPAAPPAEPPAENI